MASEVANISSCVAISFSTASESEEVDGSDFSSTESASSTASEADSVLSSETSSIEMLSTVELGAYKWSTAVSSMG